ncbi:MAG: TlpA family protein disulfide reductase [Gammaproteobacteria bacterium]|nr:TlpA family protein disulfide reductase [Gammaproteobacteria bacterium]
MSRVMLIFGVALLALMAGALFYAARIPIETPPPAPQPKQLEVVTHPAFTLPDMEGASREFAEWDGRHRLLNFWATWCAPCRREIPLLKDFQDEHGEAGFQVLGIAVDFPEDVTKYAAQAEFNYPVLVGQQDAMAVAESSGIEFIGMPFTMFVTRDGEYVGAYIGELHQSHLNDIVNILERLDAGEITKDEARGAFKLL